jgi:glyoxylase-like metal-dependent hydrolase (beta-lactamase superfamily II)
MHVFFFPSSFSARFWAWRLISLFFREKFLPATQTSGIPHFPHRSGVYKTVLAVWLCFFLFAERVLAMLALMFLTFVSVNSLNVMSFLRPGDPTKLSSNSFIVYDDDEVLIVDVGGIYDPYTDNELMPALKPLLVSRRLNGAYLTHGHIDHIGQLAHLTTLLPGIKLFVADQGTKDEAKQLNAIFSAILQLNSSNPIRKFDLSQLQIAKSGDLWNGPASVVVHVGDLLGETNHFGVLEFRESNNESHIFVGDFSFAPEDHMYIAYDVSLMASCDWLQGLQYFSNYVANSGLNTSIYFGHGKPISSDVVVSSTQDRMAYLAFSRTVYGEECDPAAATSRIFAKYPTLLSQFLVAGFNSPLRVPADAKILGCPCSASTPRCPGIVPSCQTDLNPKNVGFFAI